MNTLGTASQVFCLSQTVLGNQIPTKASPTTLTAPYTRNAPPGPPGAAATSAGKDLALANPNMPLAVATTAMPEERASAGMSSTATFDDRMNALRLVKERT